QKTSSSTGPIRRNCSGAQTMKRLASNTWLAMASNSSVVILIRKGSRMRIHHTTGQLRETLSIIRIGYSAKTASQEQFSAAAPICKSIESGRSFLLRCEVRDDSSGLGRGRHRVFGSGDWLRLSLRRDANEDRRKSQWASPFGGSA